jgi:hypothetical protein
MECAGQTFHTMYKSAICVSVPFIYFNINRFHRDTIERILNKTMLRFSYREMKYQSNIIITVLVHHPVNIFIINS